jgi:hypothetical protein
MAGIHGKVWQNTPAWRDAFWDFCRKMAIRDAARTVWLPALAMGIRTETDHQVLQVMMRWPLPDSLPPGTAPWRATVMSAWNIVPGRVRYRERTDILGMPVRLDRLGGEPGWRPHLVRWLEEARQALRLKKTEAARRLAALAAWRPPPESRLAPEVLFRWKVFWNELSRAEQPPVFQAVALQALLNLAEGGVDNGKGNPDDLVRRFTGLLQKVEQGDFRTGFSRVWQPTPQTPCSPEVLREAACVWLKMGTRPEPAGNLFLPPAKTAAWEVLMDWSRGGGLARCGQELLPALTEVVRSGQHPDLLLKLSAWFSSTGGQMADSAAWSALSEGWNRLSRHNQHPLLCRAGWQGRIGLWLDRRLPPSDEAAFRQDYAAAVEAEETPAVMFVLAQGLARTDAGALPVANWLKRLSGGSPEIRLAAELALWTHLEAKACEMMQDQEGNSGSVEPESVCRAAGWQRRVRQTLRQYGREKSSPEPFVNLHPCDLPFHQRLLVLAEALSAGHPVPPVRRGPSSLHLTRLPVERRWDTERSGRAEHGPSPIPARTSAAASPTPDRTRETGNGNPESPALQGRDIRRTLFYQAKPVVK